MEEYFEDIEDIRQQGKNKYNLVEVIVMAVVAVTAGAENWKEIGVYCGGKLEVFREKYGLKLESGIPKVETFHRIFTMIRPDQLETCFWSWVKTACPIEEQELVILDGKVLRGSWDDSFNHVHRISVWANQTGIVLGQMRAYEESNEISAVPELLDLIDIEGCIFTSDEMNCQKQTVEKITEKNCDYVICLNENHETLYENAKLYFDTALAQPELCNFMQSKPETEKGDDRIEIRQYFLSKEIADFINSNEWSDIAALGMVRSKQIIDYEERTEDRYFVTSLTDLSQFYQTAKMHWGIENNPLWCLDVNFEEDKCRIRMDHSEKNLAVLRHISVTLYRSYTKVRFSMRAKRLRCAFDDVYLHAVIFNQSP